ncbi:MAG: hypothetical protein RID18_08305, partial [Cytophagales bacterium]
MVRSKHVAIIIQSLSIGGAEKQALMLADGLASTSNFQITLVTLETTELQWNQYERHPHITTLLAPYRHTASRLGKLLVLLRVLFFFRQLKADVLIPFTYYPNLFSSLLWKLSGAKAGFWNQRDLGVHFVVDRITQLALKCPTAFISNSDGGKYFLKSQLKKITKPIYVIKNGIKIDESILLKSLPVGNQFKLVMVGNLHKNKDHITLIRAW